MCKKINDGGPAFPQAETANGNTVWDEHGQGGMSLRDWFAGQALAGMCANGKAVLINGREVGHETAAYIVADAMLRAREAT